jgi:CRISPR/Cas system-associated exonuclease Cas4 (RecB family)
MIALSWSRLNSFQECPRKFHLQFITKSFPEEGKSIHLVKGEQLHKQLEDYVIAKNGGAAMTLGFSTEVKKTLPYVDKLFSLYDQVHPEAQVAADIDWNPCEWFDKKTAWRSIWDVVGLKSNTVFIGDYKSGKIYPYGATYGQLHLSAVMALERFKEVPEVNTAYIYIEHEKIHRVKVTRAEVPEVKAHFEKIFQRVQHEKNYDPTPNDNCKWCPATKMQCKFSRKL